MARTPIEIVAHCAAQARFHAAVISGTPLPYRTADDLSRATDQSRTLDDALGFLEASVGELLAAIGDLPDARLSEEMTMPWGERVPVPFGMVSGALHIQYHLGQVGQLQTMLGDDEEH